MPGLMTTSATQVLYLPTGSGGGSVRFSRYGSCGTISLAHAAEGRRLIHASIQANAFVPEYIID